MHAYVPYVRHRDPTPQEKSAAAPATAELNGMMAARHTRFPDTRVVAGGGNAPAAPGAAEPLPTDASPEEAPSDDGAVEASPDEDTKRIPNTPAEAMSLRHLLTHLPKNEHFAACMRATMTKKHARRRHTPAGPDAPVSFGDSITADHLFSIGERGKGSGGEKYAMVVLDLGTRWREC